MEINIKIFIHVVKFYILWNSVLPSNGFKFYVKNNNSSKLTSFLFINRQTESFEVKLKRKNLTNK